MNVRRGSISDLHTMKTIEITRPATVGQYEMFNINKNGGQKTYEGRLPVIVIHTIEDEMYKYYLRNFLSAINFAISSYLLRMSRTLSYSHPMSSATASSAF